MKTDSEKIKNAVRIIDGVIEEYAEIRKEQCALPLEQYNYQYEWGLWLTTCKLRKIRDELIQEEKDRKNSRK